VSRPATFSVKMLPRVSMISALNLRCLRCGRKATECGSTAQLLAVDERGWRDAGRDRTGQARRGGGLTAPAALATVRVR
jgi:hypothetical protein